MSRVALVLVLLLSAPVASAADLPPGALVRLGDDRFRAGSGVYNLAISPDGKQFATVRPTATGMLSLAVWDATTGRPIREHPVNEELFKGLTWGPGGARAVVIRADAETKTAPAQLHPDDFRVWDFTDPKAVVPPALPVSIGFHAPGFVQAERPKGGAKYTDFHVSADGRRVAARWESAAGKHAVHVFELKPVATVAKLARVGTIDLGAEGADEMRVSADGKTVVTLRALVNPDRSKFSDERIATVWDVATGKPTKPLRLPDVKRLMPTPDGRALVMYAAEEHEWGFDHFDLTSGKLRKLIRWRYTAAQLVHHDSPDDAGGFAFTPDGREFVVGIDLKTYVIDLITGKELGRLEGHADTPCAVAVSADGACIATADVYGLVRLWDANTLRPFEEAKGHRAPVEYAELSPDGMRLLTWAEDETVRFWDVATGKELRAFTGAPGLLDENRVVRDQPTFTPDGTAILFSTNKRLTVRDLLTGLEIPLPGDMAKLTSRFAVFAPDGKAVMTWTESKEHSFPFEVWDWPGGMKRFAVADNLEMKSPGFSPDGSAVYLNASSPHRWDAKTGKELPPAWKDDRRADPLLSLRPNPRLLLDDTDHRPRVIEAGTGAAVSRVRLAHADEGTQLVGGWGVALSPAGGQFAVSLGFEPGYAMLCEAATGQVRRELRGHRGTVRVLGFTPDGTKLLTAGGDHTVLVWDMRLQHVPLPDAVKKETSAAKLWDTLATGNAKDAYLAMARLAREPDAALKMAKMKLKPATKEDRGTDAANLADARAVELLEALGTDESRLLLKELAAGHADAFRTQEAKRALERKEKK